MFLVSDSTGGNIIHEVSSFIGKQPEEYLSPMKLAGGVLIHPVFINSTHSKSELEIKSDGYFNFEMLDMVALLLLLLLAVSFEVL